jgi:hypothetical protein
VALLTADVDSMKVVRFYTIFHLQNALRIQITDIFSLQKEPTKLTPCTEHDIRNN